MSSAKMATICPAGDELTKQPHDKTTIPQDILPCGDDISAVWHDGSCQMPVVTFRLMYAMHEQIPYFMRRVTEDLGPCRGDKPGVFLGYGITNTTSTTHYVRLCMGGNAFDSIDHSTCFVFLLILSQSIMAA